jgi:hypothetical protein
MVRARNRGNIASEIRACLAYSTIWNGNLRPFSLSILLPCESIEFRSLSGTAAFLRRMPSVGNASTSIHLDCAHKTSEATEWDEIVNKRTPASLLNSRKAGEDSVYFHG